MADNELKLRVVVDAGGAISVFNELGEEIKKTEQNTKQAGQGFSDFQAQIVSLYSGLGLAKEAFGAISGAIGTIGHSIKEGARLADLEAGLDNLAKKAGTTASVLTGELNEAFGETIENSELMRIANEGLIAKLDPTAFDEIAKAARSYADTIGGDAKEEFEAFIAGLARGDDRFLKSRGILLDNEQAFKDYAEQIGVAKDRLNELQKAEAIKAAATRALVSQVDRLGEVTNDAGDEFERLRAILVNVRDQFYKSIGGSQELAKQLSAVNDEIEKLIQGAKIWIEIINKSAGQTLWETIVGANDTAGYVFIKDILGEIADTVINTGDALDSAANSAGKLGDTLVSVGDVSGTIFGPGNQEGQLEFAKNYWATQDKGAKVAADSIRDARKAAEEFQDEQEQLRLEILNNGGFGPGNDQGQIDFERAKKASAGFFGYDIGLDSGLETVLADSLSDVAATAIKSAFSGEALHNEDWAQMGGSIAGSISNHFLPGSGPIAEALTEGLIGMLDSADPSRLARQSVDKYFADLFDKNRLQILIDGQLTELNDLVFNHGSFAEGTFDDAFQGLEPAAREAFSGVGMAFEEMTGTISDIGGQLGSVLVNNLGGDLNNLQLLVSATGSSFEDLRKAVVKAALDGRTSFLEAQSALNGLGQLAENGIPGKIGAVSEALRNMQNAGSTGGRVTIDALRDIGAEALELGSHTLPELQAQLLASGESTASGIQTVMDALSHAGIQSIENLANATDEQLISILSELESKDFLQNMGNKVDELLGKLNSIPEKIESRVIINVESRGDTKALEQAAALGPGQRTV